MTLEQQKQMERDLLLPRLSDAVIDIRVSLKKPSREELRQLEIERDLISQYLDKFKVMEEAQ